MRITEIALQNFRSIHNETFQLPPVTVVTGGNGAGKSTLLGAIGYAITGRYPGMQVHTVDKARALAGQRGNFEVRLATSEPEFVIERGLQGARFFLRATGEGVAASRNVEEAEISIGRTFGDPSWMLDAFDPVRSVWQLSDEAWTRWMYGICTLGSGWTKQRLVEALDTPPNDDWDPDVASDPAACLELTLARAEERLRAARTVARDARAFVEGLSPEPDAAPDLGAIAAAEAEWQKAADHVSELELGLARRELMESILARVDHGRREVVGLEQLIARVAGDDDGRTRQQQIERLEADLIGATLALDEARSAYLRTEVLRQLIQSCRSGVRHVVSGGITCSVCNGDVPVKRILPAAPDTQAARVRFIQENQRYHDVFTALHEEKTRLAVQEAVAKHIAAERVHLQHQVASLTERIEKEAASVERLRAEHAAAPPVTDEEIAAACARRHVLRERLDEARAREGIARERKGQLDAAHAADTRGSDLSDWIARLREVRSRMLADSIEPLQQALVALKPLAPAGSAWRVVGPAHRIGEQRGFGLMRGQIQIPVHAMSDAERLRATIALIAAVAKVRRAPWVGLVVDNFERVAPGERGRLLQELTTLAEDNVFHNVVIGAVGGVAEWELCVGRTRVTEMGPRASPWEHEVRA